MAVQDENSFQPVIDRFEDDVLSLAYYTRDRDVICGFLPDSVTYGVHPDLWVLTAVEELVSGSRLDKIGEAVAMLEYLHSHYPDLGEEREYVNLIVDMKTKASTYELFFAGVVSESDKQVILDKYFDPDLCNSQLPPPDSQTDYSDLSDEQYNLTIHSVARNGILNMMSSSERCRQFQQTIMNPLYSPAIHENLLRNLRSYLDQIKRQLPVPALLQSFAATHSNQLSRSSSLTAETRPRVIADDRDYSQPPLLDEPTTSGLHLHIHPPPPPTLPDSSTENKKLPTAKTVKIQITPCLTKQPPSQQPLFESSVSPLSDLGSEANIISESDLEKQGAYKLRKRKKRPFPLSSSSESEDTKIRRSLRQKTVQRRKVNGIRESVYKDLSSSEIESIDDLESVSSGAEDSTELSDSTDLTLSDSKKQHESTSVGETPTKIRKSTRLRNMESGSRRMSPRKLHISSESERSRKFKATALKLIRSKRKQDLDKAEFIASSSRTRDSSLESESSRLTMMELRKSERRQDLDKESGSHCKRDNSLESDNSRKFRAELRNGERKRYLDKPDFQTRSPCRRDSSLDSENSRNSRNTAKELRSKKKQDLTHKRDGSSESASTTAMAVKLRRSERKRGTDSQTRSEDSSSESENTKKLKATTVKLKSERRLCFDSQTSSPHKRDSSSELETTKKSRATAVERRRGERKRDLSTCSSPHKRDSSSESEIVRKSGARVMMIKSSEEKQDSDNVKFQPHSSHKGDSSSESGSLQATTMKLRSHREKQNSEKTDFQAHSSHKRDSSSESGSLQATTMKRRSHREKQNSEKTEFQVHSPHKRDSSLESENLQATTMKLRSSREIEKSEETDFQAHSSHNGDSSSESGSLQVTAMKLRSHREKQNSEKTDFQAHSPHKRDNSSESGSILATAMKLRSHREKQNSEKTDFQIHSPHRRDSSSESGSILTTTMKLRHSREKQNSERTDFQSGSSTEEEIRRSKGTKHSKGDHKTTSPKKKPSSASYTESDSESESALGTHHQYILRQREKDVPVKRSSQTQGFIIAVPEQKSKHQSLLMSKSDKSGSECEMEKEESLHSEKGKAISEDAHCANLLQKVIKFISSETDHDNLRDGDAATSHETTEVKKLLKKHSKDVASNRKRKGSGKSMRNSSQPRYIVYKPSNRTSPLATIKSAVESNEESPSKTTNAVKQGDNGLVQKNAVMADFCGHRLRSHPGNNTPSPSKVNPQSSETQSSPSATSGKVIKGHHTNPGDLASKRNQRKTPAVPAGSKDSASGNEQQGKKSRTKTLVDNKKVRKRRKGGDSGSSSMKENKNQSFSPRKSERDHRKDDIQRTNSIIEELAKNKGDSSVRTSSRRHASRTTQESQVQHQRENSSPGSERRSEHLPRVKDISSSSSQCQATGQNTHEHSTHTAVTDHTTNSRMVTSDNALQQSPATAQKSSAKVLSPDEARAGLSQSLPRDFKRPKKRLNFSQNDSGGDSDSGVRNAVKRVRFAASLDSGELSEMDTTLLTATSESRQGQESPRKPPADGTTSNIETSSTDSSLQLASEIIVSSNALDPIRPPSLPSSPSSDGNKKSSKKTKKLPQTPPTQLSQRGDEGVVRLPSPPAGTQTALCCDATSVDETTDGGSSGIHTVLSQVSQLQQSKRRPSQSKRQRTAPREKAESRRRKSRKGWSSRSRSAQKSASMTTKSPQTNNEGVTSSGSMYETTSHENAVTPTEKGMPRKDESSRSPQINKEVANSGTTLGATAHENTVTPREKGTPRKDKSSRSPQTNKEVTNSGSRLGATARENTVTPTKKDTPRKDKSSKSPQISKEVANSGTTSGATAHENTKTPRKRGRPSKRESSNKDESATKPPSPKKRRKECHTPDVHVPPASHGSEMDSTSSTKSPRRKTTRKNRRSLGSGKSSKSSNKECHSLNCDKDSGSSNKEPQSSGDSHANDITKDHYSSGGGDSGVTNSHKELYSSSGVRGTGDSSRGDTPADYGTQRVEPLASTSRGATVASTTGYYGNQDSTLYTLQSNFPVPSVHTSDTGSYGDTNIHAQCHASPEKSGQQFSSQVDDVVQSPEIDVVGYTPEYSETAGTVADDVMGLQGQGHVLTTPGYQFNTNGQIVTHPPSIGCPHTNPTMCNQSISSNTDILISTHPPYIPNIGCLLTSVSNCNPRAPSNMDQTLPLYVSNSGGPCTNYNPSTPSNTDRLVRTDPPYPSNIRHPSTNFSNLTPSCPDRLLSMHPPYSIVSSDGSDLSRYYHEDSPGNSPVIGLMNHSPVSRNNNIVKSTTPCSSKQHQSQSSRSAHVGAYPQDETSGHGLIGLMNHLPFIKTRMHYSSKQQQQSSLRDANIGAYPQNDTSGHEQLNLIDSEYELSQVQSQYYHAPVQRVARQIPNYSDNESIVSESAVSSNGTPAPSLT